MIVEGEAQKLQEWSRAFHKAQCLEHFYFLLFVYDICKIVVSLTRLFADDCLLYNKVYNHGNEDRLHNDLYKLEK